MPQVRPLHAKAGSPSRACSSQNCAPRAVRERTAALHPPQTHLPSSWTRSWSPPNATRPYCRPEPASHLPAMWRTSTSTSPCCSPTVSSVGPSASSTARPPPPAISRVPRPDQPLRPPAAPRARADPTRRGKVCCSRRDGSHPPPLRTARQVPARLLVPPPSPSRPAGIPRRKRPRQPARPVLAQRSGALGPRPDLLPGAPPARRGFMHRSWWWR